MSALLRKRPAYAEDDSVTHSSCNIVPAAHTCAVRRDYGDQPETAAGCDNVYNAEGGDLGSFLVSRFVNRFDRPEQRSSASSFSIDDRFNTSA